ncbi:MAG: Crp/Fnr family transcriptional regulator [Pseudomonadota bacterium]
MISDDTDRICNALRFSSYFCAWPQEDIITLASLCKWRRIEADTILIGAGEKASSLYLIVNGHVELSYADGDGAGGVIDLLENGQLVGECALAHDGCYAVTVRTLERTTVIDIDGRGFSAFLAEHFDRALTMMSALTERLCRLLRQAEELKCLSAAQRLGIYVLADAVPVDGAYETPLTIEKGVLARKLGMKAETLSRALKKLSEIGVSQIANGRVMRIEDPEALAAWCGLSDADTEEGGENAFKTAV